MVINVICKIIYYSFMIMLYLMFFPLWLMGKLFFWWLPSGNDGNDGWYFWKEHGHEW